PRRVANRTAPERVEAIVKLRRLRFTAAEIAETLGMALSTVSGILTRTGMGKLGRLGREQPVRYERSRPGELVHIDVKRLGRIEGGSGKRAFEAQRRKRHNPRLTDRDGVRRYHVGYECVHVCVDDYSRLAYAEVLPDETATTAVAFYQRHGITVERVLTDNGSAYRGVIHAIACRRLAIKHLRTRPYRPQTNGKAERFIRTLLNGWDTQPSATNPRPPEPTRSGPTASYPFPRDQLPRRRPGAARVRPRIARAHAQRPRRGHGRDGLYPGLAGRNAHRRAEPHAPDARGGGALLRQQHRALPRPEVDTALPA